MSERKRRMNNMEVVAVEEGERKGVQGTYSFSHTLFLCLIQNNRPWIM